MFGGEKDVVIDTAVKQLDHPIKLDVYKNDSIIGEYDIDTSEKEIHNFINLDISRHINIVSNDNWCPIIVIEPLAVDSDPSNSTFIITLTRASYDPNNILDAKYMIITNAGSEFDSRTMFISLSSLLLDGHTVYSSDYISLGIEEQKITVYVKGALATNMVVSIIPSYRASKHCKCIIKTPDVSELISTIPGLPKKPVSRSDNYIRSINNKIQFLKGITLGEYLQNKIEMVPVQEWMDTELITYLSFKTNTTNGVVVLDNVGNPIYSNQAANKKYVDTSIKTLEARIAALEAAASATNNES